MSKKSCGESIPFLLKEYGVDTVFGMPGVHSLEFYRGLDDAGIRHIGVRHEQGAVFMADGFARASGKPGVAMLISGPGVTNASTPLGQAYSDSIPLLMLTSVIATGDIGMDRGMLHEISDQKMVTVPLTSLSVITYTADQVAKQVARAFTRFNAQRPRPVHISIPLDVLEEPVEASPCLNSIPDRPGPDSSAIEQAITLIKASKSIIVLAGGGAVQASNVLGELVEKLNALFVTTVAGKGILPENHPLSLGSTLQRVHTRKTIADADLMIAVGTEISEPDLYVTADAEAAGDVDPELLLPILSVKGKFIRIDLDPDVVIRDYDPDVCIVSDSRLALESIVEKLSNHQVKDESRAGQAVAVRQANMKSLSELEQKHDLVLAALRNGLPNDALIYVDMTQIGYTGCITFPVEQHSCWHFPMGYGTLGFALPAAIGGKIACPDRSCAVVVGDGGFQFTLQELATAVELELPMPVLLWDNDALGEIADFMQAREIPQVSTYPKNPDFESLAKAYGLGYENPCTASEITAAVQIALSNTTPTLIHVKQKSIGTGNNNGA